MLYMTMYVQCVLCSWLAQMDPGIPPTSRLADSPTRQAAAPGQQPGVLLTLLHVGQVPAIELAEEAVRIADKLLGHHCRLRGGHARAAHSLLDVLQLPLLRGPAVQAQGSQGGQAAGGFRRAPKFTHDSLHRLRCWLQGSRQLHGLHPGHGHGTGRCGADDILLYSGMRTRESNPGLARGRGLC